MEYYDHDNYDYESFAEKHIRNWVDNELRSSGSDKYLTDLTTLDFFYEFGEEVISYLIEASISGAKENPVFKVQLDRQINGLPYDDPMIYLEYGDNNYVKDDLKTYFWMMVDNQN